MSELTGTTYKRDNDGLWEFRVKSRNGRTVATSGGQGYRRRKTAERTMRRLLEPMLFIDNSNVRPGVTMKITAWTGLRRRTYGQAVVYLRDDGLYDWRILRRGKIICVSHNQGYKNIADAAKTMVNVIRWGHVVA